MIAISSSIHTSDSHRGVCLNWLINPGGWHGLTPEWGQLGGVTFRERTRLLPLPLLFPAQSPSASPVTASESRSCEAVCCGGQVASK